MILGMSCDLIWLIITFLLCVKLVVQIRIISHPPFLLQVTKQKQTPWPKIKGFNFGELSFRKKRIMFRWICRLNAISSGSGARSGFEGLVFRQKPSSSPHILSCSCNSVQGIIHISYQLSQNNASGPGATHRNKEQNGFRLSGYPSFASIMMMMSEDGLFGK